MSAATHQQQPIEAGLRDVLAEGAGCLTLIVIDAATSHDGLLGALGEAQASAALNAAAQAIRRARTDALPCVLCGALRRGKAIAVLIPYGGMPGPAIGLPICASCTDASPSKRALAHCVVTRLRGALPGLRTLPALAQAGHA